MHNKRSQISIFFIIGALVLVAVALVIVFYKYGNNLGNLTEPVGLQVKNFVDSCLSDTTPEALYYIGAHGGYYTVRLPNAEEDSADIPYYFDLGVMHVPPINTIEREFARYIEENIPNCINGFRAFTGVNITSKSPSATVSFGNGTILVLLNYPIEITEAGSVTRLNDFTYSYDFNFLSKYDMIAQIIEVQKDEPNSVPISYIMYQCSQNLCEFELSHAPNGTVIYHFIFPHNPKPFKYSIAARYVWAEPEIASFYLEPIPEVNITKPDNINIQVNATGEGVHYYDYTALFDVDNTTGWLTVPAWQLENGVYDYMIKAVDKYGNEAYDYLVLNVNITGAGQ